MDERLEDGRVAAWLENLKTARIREYVRRGRPLGNQGTESLEKSWIAAVVLWAKTPVGSDQCDRLEIECELALRGRKLPETEVTDALSVLWDSAHEFMDALLSDATRRACLKVDLERRTCEHEQSIMVPKN